MAPLTRAKASSSRAATLLIQSDSDSENDSSASSDFDDEQGGGDYSEEEEEEEDKGVSGLGASEVREEPPKTTNKGPTPITISLKKVCKVCKGTGHAAGFRGATYIDCPKKPCYLCKMPGHTTMSCPHRVAMEHGVVPAPRRNTGTSLDYVFQRQIKPNIPMIKPAFVIPNQLSCGIIRFHSRRVTCLEFHPTKSGVLLSGDKKGQVGIWDYSKLHEKTVYKSIHSCLVNNIRFSSSNDGTVYASSSDGTISCTDLETGEPFFLLNLNPNGWNGPTTWRMLYGLDINQEKGLVLVADNFGCLYFLDARSKTKAGGPFLIHRKGTKIVGLHCNPVEPGLLLSCGNDHFARIWDIRHLEAGSSLYNLHHGRVVNSAYFSPRTGSKILTTSIDNRIRVWDSIFTNMETPSREIVHSHDFNRHLTPFRAEWDPKDPSESLAVIGRYISENYNGVALHPIDFIDTTSGKLVAEVIEPDITTISPVNKLHPRDDVLATGSSRSLFIWRPKPKQDAECMQEQSGRKSKEFIIGMGDKKSSGKDCIDSDDDSDFGSKGKKSKAKKHGKSDGSGKSKKSKGAC
ncbi:hypothetical protein J5N97_002469 [Dioscorea zingiberensis]|uniref:Protein DAMAGED DNA-BINDING 2 n=1 Tax=Dioscorea zingiberensis TaxID=325984 RepID=A0A9D5D4T5_9LILI|nr:hypothetical protein J5N97_002469 [Dioscorea zingiberensis]